MTSPDENNTNATAKVVVDLYDAFEREGMDVVRTALADDVQLHASGRGPMSGTYEGKMKS